jgi:arsenite-transporting ATPase
VRVLCAPYFDQEVVGPEMLDRLAAALFGAQQLDPAAVLHDSVTQQLTVSEREARLRLELPLARKGDVSLKKVGAELVVRVDGHKRTITLPDALARFQPSSATFADGALEVVFDGAPEPAASDSTPADRVSNAR